MFPLKDSIELSRLQAVTCTIILLNIVVFAWESVLSRTQFETFIYAFGLVPVEFLHDYWRESARIISSMFVHGDFLHLVGNMWFLWIFGDAVEERFGRANFLFLYVICGAIAAVLQLLTTPLSTVPIVGASGAISGVLGAYMVSFPRATVSTVLLAGFFSRIIELPAVFYFSIWFLVQFIAGLVSLFHSNTDGQTIAFWAHVFGFVAGILHAKLLQSIRSSNGSGSINSKTDFFRA